MNVRLSILLMTLIISVITSYHALNSQFCHHNIMDLLSKKLNDAQSKKLTTMGEILKNGQFELISCRCFGAFLFKWTTKPVAAPPRILYFRMEQTQFYTWTSDLANDTWYTLSYPSIRSYIER